LSKTESNGLSPFFYLPHAHFISTYGLKHPEEGLRANYELTKRFTAEFSIRPFIIEHEKLTLAKLRLWTRDKNSHVRRLVSEGTRPRLPWASRLPKFQKDPTPVLELLELLKDDPEQYVRRSVANNLGDIAKDHWEVALKVCQAWLDEVGGFKDNERSQARCWIIRHAVRLPAQKGVKEALKLRKMAGGKGVNA
jgi:3-methyladenine DNA glycosylase AlkC